MPTCDQFDTSILAVTPLQRGPMAGASNKLRRQYRDGAVDPAAHNNVGLSRDESSALTTNGQMANWQAITGP